MEKYYAFAGLEFAVSARDEWMYEDDRMLAPFRVDSVSDPHRFTFKIVETLTPPTGDLAATMDNFVAYWDGDTRTRYTGAVNGNWQTAYMRARHRGNDHTVELKSRSHSYGMSPKSVLNALEVEHLTAGANGFVFHSSYIEVDGKGILFTAPSGTGKSTQADLWHDLRGAKILNGDRSAVRCTENGVVVCGIPFMGSSQYCENVTLPLAGIVYLSQAPQTTIRPLRGLQAFRSVWEGVSVNTWDKEDVAKVMDTVTQVVSAVPVWQLACTPDETAVAALERQLGK